jgi:hypothetical protein
MCISFLRGLKKLAHERFLRIPGKIGNEQGVDPRGEVAVLSAYVHTGASGTGEVIGISKTYNCAI